MSAPLAIAVLDRIEQLRKQGSAFCVVTVTSTAGATSAKPGAKAIVEAAGELYGHVGGSCVKHAVVKAAQDAMRIGKACSIRVKPSDEIDDDASDDANLYASGCPSRGTMGFFIEPYGQPHTYVLGKSKAAELYARCARLTGFAADAQSSDELAATKLRAWDAAIILYEGKKTIDLIHAAINSPACCVGLVASKDQFSELAAEFAKRNPERSISCLQIPAAFDISPWGHAQTAVAAFASIIQARAGRIDDDAPNAASKDVICLYSPDDESISFKDQYGFKPTVHIIGSSPIAAACADYAKLLELDAMVHDKAVPQDTLEHYDPVIVATQGQADLVALRSALDSSASWIGMVASPRKTKWLLSELEQDFSQQRLACLSAPAGLDIQAASTEEIALSTFAEIIQGWNRVHVQN